MRTDQIASVVDASLRDVLRKQLEGFPLPVTLRRFAENCEADSVSDAMEATVGRLLAKINGDGKVAPGRAVSVESLCDACGVTIAGSKRASSSADQSWDAYFRGSSHVGEIIFQGNAALIRVPHRMDFSAARISIAHELGHFLIHAQSQDGVTKRLPSTPEEEALAEYGARLLLMPHREVKVEETANLAANALSLSRRMRTTLHSAVSRLGDPDTGVSDMRGAILWRFSESAPQHATIEQRLSPFWHLCSPAFVPVRRCKAREGSIIARAAAERDGATGSAIEDVRIGTFSGVFRVDVVAWGSIADGARAILSVFRSVQHPQDRNATTINALRSSRQLALI
jgi:hypothetical protein